MCWFQAPAWNQFEDLIVNGQMSHLLPLSGIRRASSCLIKRRGGRACPAIGGVKLIASLSAPVAHPPRAGKSGSQIKNMHYVYILYSRKLNKFYTGYTQNLKKRIKAHNKKTVSFTSKGCPWNLVYYEAFIEKEDAQREEQFLKTGKGRERRNYLLMSLIDKIKK